MKGHKKYLIHYLKYPYTLNSDCDGYSEINAKTSLEARTNFLSKKTSKKNKVFIISISEVK